MCLLTGRVLPRASFKRTQTPHLCWDLQSETPRTEGQVTNSEPEKTTEPTTSDRAAEVAATEGREDNRNELAEGSPVPDPTQDDTGADDIPDAD